MTRFLLKLHTYIALISFLPLILMSVSGAILVFKHEIDRVLMPTNVRVAATATERLPLDSLQSKVYAQYPDWHITGWVLFQDQGRADLVYMIPNGSDQWHYLLLDQYQGHVLAPPVDTHHYLTDWLLDFHYTFALDHTGLYLAAFFAVALCLIGVSGIIIHRSYWYSLFKWKRQKRRTGFYREFHKKVGAWASPVLLILGITGGYWNIMHVVQEDFLEEHHEHHKMAEPLYDRALPLQALVNTAEASVSGFVATYISFPWEPGANLRVWGEVPTLNPFASEYSSTISFDAHNGERLSIYDIREQAFGAKLLDSFRELHFGSFASWPSKVLWCLVGLLPLILTFTGGYLWWQRRVIKARKTYQGQSAAG